MKIAFVVDYWAGSKGGGVMAFNTNLAEALKLAGHDVHVLFRLGEDSGQCKLPEAKREFVRAATEKLRELRPDAVVCQDGWFLAMPAAKCGCGVRIAIFHTHFDRPLPLFKAFLYRRMLARLDALCFVSRGLQENVREMLGVSHPKSFVVHPGVKVPSVADGEAAAFRKRHGVPDSATLILMHAGTLHEPKARGARLLIDTLALVRKTHPDVRLAITRDGPFLNSLRSHAEEIGLSDCVVLTGDLDRPEAAMAAADIYAHISFGDGYPVSILEAMAMGKPVVASDIPGVSEAVLDGRTGLLAANDAGAVSQALHKLLNDPALSKSLAENGRKDAVEKHTWDKVACDIVKILGGCRDAGARGGAR
jgi:glycosyltransferase involved in cell wall biosynthesis